MLKLYISVISARSFSYVRVLNPAPAAKFASQWPSKDARLGGARRDLQRRFDGVINDVTYLALPFTTLRRTVYGPGIKAQS